VLPARASIASGPGRGSPKDLLSLARPLLAILLAAPILALILFMAGPTLAVPIQPPPPADTGDEVSTINQDCEDGPQPSGAIYRICVPSTGWNGELIVYAHGYVAPNRPVEIPEDQLYLSDGTYLPQVLNSMGYGFAMSSYYTNGLAIPAGLSDTVSLVDTFKTLYPTVTQVYLAGASEGGLITALGVEQYPDTFSGGLATCGPVGDFRAQIDYFGDFRVVFDYFFPGIITGTAITVPTELMDRWDNYFTTTVLPVIANPANAFSVTQLLSATHAAYDPLNPTSAISTVAGVLWYNVLGTNDAIAKLRGQPFDNHDRVYTGTTDDTALNAGVQRYVADPAALAEIESHYQTAGQPQVPIVTLHTTMDPIVPYWHETWYRTKILEHGRALWHDSVPIVRYGHCAFNQTELLWSLLLLRQRAQSPPRQMFLPLILHRHASAMSP
jgi:hypothetical protein